MLSDITALQVLRHVGVAGEIPYDDVQPLEARLPSGFVLEQARCTDAEAARLDGFARLGLCAPPYHVLVAPKHRARSRPDLRCHTCAVPPCEGAFLHVSDDVYVCSPALCLVRLAGGPMGDGRLLALAHEFCGLFTPVADRSSGTSERPMLLNRSLLEASLEGMRPMRGLARMRALAPYVLEGSRSPMESCQSMLLNLPYARGGYGFSVAGPKLNPRIELPGRSRLTGRSYYMPDLLYPKARLALEYNGRQHFDVQVSEADERRRNDFIALGYDVITVTWDQLKDDERFSVVAHAVAKKLGRRVRPGTPRFDERRLALRSELFGRGHRL